MLGDVLNQLNSKGGDMGKVVGSENIEETLLNEAAKMVTYLSQLAKRKRVVPEKVLTTQLGEIDICPPELTRND